MRRVVAFASELGATPRHYTRRAVLGSVLATTGTLVFPAGIKYAAADADDAPGTWRPWLLSRGDELRPATPGPTTSVELTELVELQGQRTAATFATIAPWNDPTVVLPWTNLALDLIRVHQPSPVRAARALALLHVALFDTLVATADARAAFPRPGPTMDNAIIPLGDA